MKLKVLIILGLVFVTVLVATTFAVYSYATPTQIHTVNEEYGEMPGEHYGMHNHWEGMHDECMEMMNEIQEEHNSTMYGEIEEPHYYHHGCH